jgi:hypothetical protein
VGCVTFIYRIYVNSRVISAVAVARLDYSRVDIDRLNLIYTAFIAARNF